MARESRREHDRARRALNGACEALHRATDTAGGLLPGDFPAPALAGEALVEVARWMRGRMSLVPAPSEADFRAPYPFRDPWEARVVLNPAERLEGLLSLQEMRLTLHRVASRPHEALHLALGADSRTARQGACAIHRLLDVLARPADVTDPAPWQAQGDGGRLRRAAERVQEAMRRMVRFLRDTHPNAASHVRLIRRMVALPLAEGMSRLERSATRGHLPDAGGSTDGGGGQTAADLAHLLVHLRRLSDSLDPLRVLDTGSHFGVHALATPWGRRSHCADGAGEGHWGMMPLLFLRLFDCSDAGAARRAGKAARMLFRVLRQADAAGRLYHAGSHAPSGVLCPPCKSASTPRDPGGHGDDPLLAHGREVALRPSSTGMPPCEAAHSMRLPKPS